jgi:hypothetical protein
MPKLFKRFKRTPAQRQAQIAAYDARYPNPTDPNVSLADLINARIADAYAPPEDDDA